ncbi:hypothetical protein [Mycoplasma struthionis]|uniref:Uncharacterized protein n=1 Tax=Mycoplasma struthionis TaxID=538220 RepID=A0A502M946_9MOLU|nr:hypothetical protein [Mycoplasma struthionis]TPI02327.1 hypothetical protein FJM01_01080 [Mycoplasma struthionis]
MNNRKKELRKITTLEIHSVWFLFLVFMALAILWLVLVYIVITLNNRYHELLKIANDFVISILMGIGTGLIWVLFGFLFIDLFKRNSITDYFQLYSFLTSLKNKSKCNVLKDARLAEFYTAKKRMSKEKFIEAMAKILEYSASSLEYENLVNEINADFAKYSFIENNIEEEKKSAIIRTVFYNILIPFAFFAIILWLVILLINNEESLRTVSRLLLIIATSVLVISISIFTYQMYIIKKTKNHESYNDFLMLSFNNYGFKKLSSANIKIK